MWLKNVSVTVKNKTKYGKGTLQVYEARVHSFGPLLDWCMQSQCASSVDSEQFQILGRRKKKFGLFWLFISHAFLLTEFLQVRDVGWLYISSALTLLSQNHLCVQICCMIHLLLRFRSQMDRVTFSCRICLNNSIFIARQCAVVQSSHDTATTIVHRWYKIVMMACTVWTAPY